jgi:WD40 repeat protein
VVAAAAVFRQPPQLRAEKRNSFSDWMPVAEAPIQNEGILQSPRCWQNHMSLSRRHFLASLASFGAAGWLSRHDARAAEARVISWPSRVVQLPPDDEDHRPPVVTAVRLHRDGQLLATAGDDHLVRVWSLADGKLVHKLDGHADWVRTIDYSPDGRVLASAGNDRQIIFWDATSGAQLDVLAVQQAAIAAIRFSHGGKVLAAVGFEETVRLYDTSTKQLVASAPAPCQDMRALVFSPDDELLAVGGRCGSVRLLSMPRGEPIRDIPAHRQRIRAIAFSSDGAYVASSGEDRLIHVAPLAGGAGYSLPRVSAKVLSLAFYGPQHLAAAGSDNQIRLWDVATKTEIGALRGHTGSVAALECKDKTLVSAGYDTTVRIWDVGDQIAAGSSGIPGRVGARPGDPKPR